jgi:hypothetical protein
MTGRSLPARGACLEDLADAKPNADDYAMAVRKMYDVLVKDTDEQTAAAMRKILLFQVSMHQHRGLISKQHCKLVGELLPKPPARGRGRPKNALGKYTYDRKYKLYLDWIYESTVDPFLTKEEFAKKRLGITDEQHKNKSSAHARVDALLQDLKPARMNYLDEGQRRSINTIFPLLITYPQRLAREWREAKECSPALSEEDFLQEVFGWVKHFGRVRTKKELHPIEIEIIDEFLEKLDEGEKLLADSESR